MVRGRLLGIDAAARPTAVRRTVTARRVYARLGVRVIHRHEEVRVLGPAG